jgi:hypothetical protein
MALNGQRSKQVSENVGGDGLSVDSKGIMNQNVADGLEIVNDFERVKLADSTLVRSMDGIKINPNVMSKINDIPLNNLNSENDPSDKDDMTAGYIPGSI